MVGWSVGKTVARKEIAGALTLTSRRIPKSDMVGTVLTANGPHSHGLKVWTHRPSALSPLRLVHLSIGFVCDDLLPKLPAYGPEARELVSVMLKLQAKSY